METTELKVIGHVNNDYISLFGIPRQSGLVDEHSVIKFEPEYEVREAFRGIEEYSHLWIIWGFSKKKSKSEWSPTVRPPRLGGNKRVGVFATRSPNRPNPIGITCVRLEALKYTESGKPYLLISGADMMNGSPVYDIKPYLPYCDSYNNATNGFAFANKDGSLKVNFPVDLQNLIDEQKIETIKNILEQDPRPQYQKDDREYGISYANYNIRFNVDNNILNVISIKEKSRY